MTGCVTAMAAEADEGARCLPAARKAMRMSEVDGFHLHQMRHTFAGQWLERGGKLATLQQVLVHASWITPVVTTLVPHKP